jgi:gamma-glutamyl hydrolase
MRINNIFFVVVLIFQCVFSKRASPPQTLTLTPIIGIVGDPMSGGCDVYSSQEEVLKHVKYVRDGYAAPNSCFTSFYVKWIEQGGGRVVPIRYDTDPTELAHLVSSLNGVLFTGGELDLGLNTTYVETAMTIFQLAQKDPNDYFPVWGTCQGFQLLNVLAAADSGVVVPGFDSEDISWSLDLTPEAFKSRLFTGLPAEIVKLLATENVTLNFHHDGVTPDTFFSTPKLSGFYDLLSTNPDRKGRVFTSTMEAKNWPIYGTQWHPERQQFEFDDFDTGINHAYDSIRVNSAVGAFFVNECRKNSHQFTNKTEEASRLIYNYNPIYNPPGSEQIYVF